jgi:hypothetical protein
MFRSWLAIVIGSLGALAPARAGAQATAPPPAQAAPPVAKPSLRPPASRPPGSVAGGQLSDEAQLSRIAGLYEAAKYLECSDEVERLLDPTSHRALRQSGIVENARVYWAACLLGAGDVEAADAPLRAAIHENPQMKPPDSLVFPQPVIERFLTVRDSLVNEIRAAEQTRIQQAQEEARRRLQAQARERDRMRELEKLASKETVIQKNSRAIAAIPFGVGQFQNREPGLGYTLLAGQALLGGLSFAAIIVQSRLATEADRVRRSGDAVNEARQEEIIRAWSVVKTGGFWAFAALAVGGVTQAQLEFVPEFREERPRRLPPSLAPKPAGAAVSALPYVDHTGGGLNVVGRF